MKREFWLTVTLVALLVGELTYLGSKPAYSQANITKYQDWHSAVTLLTSDTSRTIQAAPTLTPGATISSKFLIVTKCMGVVLVSAAQTVNVQDGSGLAIVKLPASIAAGSSFGFQYDGFPLTANQPLNIVPAAAGPSIFVECEGRIYGG